MELLLKDGAAHLTFAQPSAVPSRLPSCLSSHIVLPSGFLYKDVKQQYSTWANRKHGQVVRATLSESSVPSNEESTSWDAHQESSGGATHLTFREWLDAFYRFSRPHTTIATVIGVISVSLLAVQNRQDLTLHFAIGVLQALVPILLINIYMMGINQVMDIEIDKVNKPYLPMASGEFSINMGVSLTVACATLGFGIGALLQSKFLMWALSITYFVGTCYSLELPWLRWKQWGLSAATSIVFFRAIVLQIFPFLHVQTCILGRAPILTKPIIFLSILLCIMSSVISIFKDIPDLEGDKAHGMKSFAVQLGPKPVFWFCVYVLMATYVMAISVSMTSNVMWARIVAVVGHAIAACLLWNQASLVNVRDKGEITKFYMFIWKLFYAEFFLIQFLR